MEQLNYNLLFRWFVGLEMDEPVWNHAVFSKNRERLLYQGVASEFFRQVLAEAKPHLSDEHFTVDGTLIEAWASQKSFQKNDGGDDQPGQFRGEKRTNEPHGSKTDPEARLYRRGNRQEAKLGYLGHVLMENRHALIVDAMLTQATHVAQNVNRGGSVIDGRTTRHESYQVSQRKRPLIEKAFGWMKQTAGMRKTKLRGLAKVG